MWNTAKVEAGATVAVFGLGSVGLAVSADLFTGSIDLEAVFVNGKGQIFLGLSKEVTHVQAVTDLNTCVWSSVKGSHCGL